MSEPSVTPYGAWESPITSEVTVEEFVFPYQISIKDDAIYWIEMRSLEGGRNVIVRRSASGTTRDCTPAEFNARNKVHEYGGGDYVVKDGAIYFSNFEDQRLYRHRIGEEPFPITAPGNMRYADGIVDPNRSRLICVRQDQSGKDEPVNELVSVNLENMGIGETLVAGNDFYSSPRLSPDGARLAWLTWNHPNMPWDGTELWTGKFLDNGTLGKVEQVAGGVDESIFEPEWSPDGILHFVSDRSGWWNLYRWRNGGVEPLVEIEAEFGKPQWIFGNTLYGFDTAERIICAFNQMGFWHLARLDTRTRKLEEIETPYSEIWQVAVGSNQIVFLGSSPAETVSVVRVDPAGRDLEVLRRGRKVTIDPGYFSMPETIEFPTTGGRSAYGYYYAPRNPDYVAPGDEKPPLIVISHGGPTGSTTIALRYEIQYWTSRGFAVLDVNYGGSTGYGRAYRERLEGQWGIVDVDDCTNGARYLAEQGKVDSSRMAITGGSAGGYTTLAALTFRDTFTAGASHFGISDLVAMTEKTHKFESRYLDKLVGAYPEKAAIYRERSPINYVDRLSCPIILFQGLEDEIVPPDQSERMFESMRSRGIPTAYFPFEGEQHGFRRAENKRRSMDAELYFYSKIFRFELAEEIEPVKIENL
jgi:dipeptidyl aminopeptidase/acylaminoacyl peptidase